MGSYNFACCSVWVRSLVSYSTGRKSVGGVWE